MPTDPLSPLGAAVLDAYVVVDAERKVVAFNPHYRAMLTRSQARKLQGSPCCAHLKLGLCDEAEGCLAARCQQAGAPLRFDEIEASLTEGESSPRTVIASAAPVEGGAVILLRDVSDAAGVQRKYKEMLDQEAREKARLREQIVRKTKELMDTHMALDRVQQELMNYKKGLFG